MNMRHKAVMYFLWMSIAVSINLFFENKFAQALDLKNLKLTTQDRILILAPHPDDEVLACSGVIQEAISLNIPVKIVFLTYGDNNQWSFLVYRKHPVITPKAVKTMGLVRQSEAIRADELLGISRENLTFLGYPDFKTINIWYSHWGSSPPARGMLTEVKAVPYANAYRPNAPYKGEEILHDLKDIIGGFKPTKIFLSHPADHNPDHRALYLFTRVALWDLGGEIKPEIYPYLIHYKKWPRISIHNTDLSLLPPKPFQENRVFRFYCGSFNSSLSRKTFQNKGICNK